MAGKKEIRQPKISKTQRCIHCGDAAVEGLLVCHECHLELEFGTIPPQQPIHFCGGRSEAAEASDRAYHGGRFNSGEW